MDVNTRLVIVARDYLRGGATYVLSRNKYKLEIPTIARDNHGSHLRELLTNLIRVDINWVNPQLLGVEQPDEKTIDIYFCGMVPFDTPLQDSVWLSTDSLTNEDVKIQTLIMKAVNIL